MDKLVSCKFNIDTACFGNGSIPNITYSWDLKQI